MDFRSEENREHQTEDQQTKDKEQNNDVSNEELDRILKDIFKRYDKTFGRLKDR